MRDQAQTKVLLNRKAVETLYFATRLEKIEVGNTTRWVERDVASVNGEEIPLEIANRVFAECLKNGVMPHLEC